MLSASKLATFVAIVLFLVWASCSFLFNSIELEQRGKKTTPNTTEAYNPSIVEIPTVEMVSTQAIDIKNHTLEEELLLKYLNGNEETKLATLKKMLTHNDPSVAMELLLNAAKSHDPSKKGYGYLVGKLGITLQELFKKNPELISLAEDIFSDSEDPREQEVLFLGVSGDDTFSEIWTDTVHFAFTQSADVQFRSVVALNSDNLGDIDTAIEILSLTELRAYETNDDMERKWSLISFEKGLQRHLRFSKNLYPNWKQPTVNKVIASCNHPEVAVSTVRKLMKSLKENFPESIEKITSSYQSRDPEVIELIESYR